MSGVRRETFEVEGHPVVDLNLPSGEATFLPGEPGTVEVQVEGSYAEEFEIEQVGGRILLRTPSGPRSRWDSFDVTVRMPPGSDVEVHAAAADLEARVGIGSLAVEVASGDLRVGDIGGDATVQSASGDVEIGSVAGDLAVNTASGDVRLREARRRAVLNTASGELGVGAALAALAVSTQSGDVDVGRYEGEDLECNSTSGDVRIGLAPGLALDVEIDSISGEIHSDFSTEPSGPPPPPPPPSPGESPTEGKDATARLRVRTLSGDITLVRADGR